VSREHAVHLTDASRAMFAWRVTQDAWAEATQAYWERRAQQLEAARPRAGDFAGKAGRAGQIAAWNRLTEAATACRARGRSRDLSDLDAQYALTDLATAERFLQIHSVSGAA
jgi:hypothetical protein